MTFDPKRRLVMAKFKTVLGHNLPAGTSLTIVEEPSARAEVDKAMAARLFNSKNAVYFEDATPTPVETPDQEKNRLALEALREGRRGRTDELVATDDLVVWPDGTPKAGRKLTKDDLLDIADREGVVIETDDNKADLTRKIMNHRAMAAVVNTTNSGTVAGLIVADGDADGSTGAGTAGDADAGADGDAHGEAGEGEGDS